MCGRGKNVNPSGSAVKSLGGPPLFLLVLPVCLAVATPSPAFSQWIADGIPVCRAMDIQDACRIASDGRGGAFVVWRDYRNDGAGRGWSDVYLQRVVND